MLKGLIITVLLFSAEIGFTQVYQSDSGQLSNEKDKTHEVNSASDAITRQLPDTICSFPLLEVTTEYPGGLSKFIDDVKSNVALKKLKRGYEYHNLETIVSFIVQEDGKVADIKIIKDPGFNSGTQVINAIQRNKTKWSPGIHKNKPVRTSFTVSVIIEKTK